jgi:hypothetical protein
VGVAVALVGLAWVYVFPHSVILNNPNERTRVLQARALVEYGQWHVGEVYASRTGRLLVSDLYGRAYGGQFVNDLGLVCEDPALSPPQCVGRLYPAKAPGVALLGVPALWLAKATGWLKPGPEDEGKATWIVRLGGVTLWSLVGLWLVGRLLVRAGAGRGVAARVVLVGGFGTNALCYGVMFVGHTLAGACLVGAVWALERAGDRLANAPGRRVDARAWAWGAAGGALAAWAVMSEYHAAVAAAVVGGWAVIDRRLWRALPGFAAGGVAVLALFLWAHKVMFGHPLRTGHFFLMSAHNRDGQADGFLGIDRFRFEALFETLFDPYMGLLPLMPWVVVGVWIGAPPLLRGLGGAAGAGCGRLSTGAGRALAMIPLVYLAFVSMLAQWRVMNGWSVGPRYLVPAMMAALVVAGLGWASALRAAPKRAAGMAGLAAGGMVVISAITVVFPQLPADIRNTFVEVAWPLLWEGYGVRNLGMLWGPGTLTPFFALLCVAAVWVLWPAAPLPAAAPSPSQPQHRPARQRALLAAIALAAASLWLASTWYWPETPNHDKVLQARQLVRDHAEGWHPTDRRPLWPPAP